MRTVNKYAQAIALLETIILYSGYMAKSHNADEFRMNYERYDKARQEMLKLLKEELNDSK